ncbi:UNVERIFIED_CONTAM: hypothetical protein Sindi_2017700 [Sesamum indicum]
MSVGDFRPISCCNVLYKIIAKLLVQRLSGVLDKIISPCQTAFITGRSIGDNIMLAQELFTGYNKLRVPPRCAMKVDIRKVYDTVEWDFLLAVCNYSTFQQYSSNGLRSVLPRPHFRLDSMENLTGSLLERKDYDKEILYLPTFLYLLWKCYIWDSYNLFNKICNSPTTGSVSLQDTS